LTPPEKEPAATTRHQRPQHRLGPSRVCNVFVALHLGGKKGDLVNLQVARTDAYVKGCNRSKYSTYVQVAYSIMANYQYYPSPVESNQAEIKCGF
jgi:hypothetical protein